jgi:hypothetical protein
MGIEPTMPLLAQSIIGFEDRGRHQSGTRIHRGSYTEMAARPSGAGSRDDHARGMSVSRGGLRFEDG